MGDPSPCGIPESYLGSEYGGGLGEGADIRTSDGRGRGATSAGGWDAGAAVMKFESRMPFGFWVESNNTVDREASSEAKSDCSEYLNGHVFDVIVWTTTWHLLHVLGARVAALTAVDLA
ncbi:Uncharacterized protein HZ326_30805 [Fusarium oxysporum f. sp. albedinis]|nr:Uncharacterized protein HZ326_30805 [Fusarium oxysporum f. sp. albedinis]